MIFRVELFDEIVLVSQFKKYSIPLFFEVLNSANKA